MLRLVEKIGGASSFLPGGKKDLGPGSGAGSKADGWLPGGRLVNWVPFFVLQVFIKFFSSSS